MIQVDLIRGRILRSMLQLKSYISCLQTTELEALTRLTGPQGVETCARIADFILTELGHVAPTTNGKTQSHRAVARALHDIASPVEKPVKRYAKRRKARASKATLKPFSMAPTENVTLTVPESGDATAEAR